MLRYTGTFIFGIFLGQEYGKSIPNIKKTTIEVIKEIKKSEIYRIINDQEK
jgi:hypothetical protein